MTTVGEFWDKRIEEACQETAEKAGAEATLKAQREIAKNMKKENIPSDIIARATGLPIDEIEKLTSDN